MKRLTRFLLPLAALLLCESAAAIAPKKSHKLYMRAPGEYILVAQNLNRMQLDGAGYIAISQSKFQNYYVSIADSTAEVHLVSASDPGLLDPAWKNVDQRAVWTDEDEEDQGEQLFVIQGDGVRDPSYIFKMPRQALGTPQFVGQLENETLGVNIDSQSQARLSLRDRDGDGKVDLLIQRPSGLVPVMVSNILANQSKLRFLENPKRKAEKVSARDHCGFRLQYPMGSSGVLFSRSCQTAYVLPPETAVEARVSSEPALCQELKFLRKKAQETLSAGNGLEDISDEAFKTTFDIVKQLREKSLDKVLVETRYTMKWDEEVARHQDLNKNGPIMNWEKLPIMRVEVDGRPIGLPKDLDDFVAKRSILPNLACGETPPASRSVRFIYKPWFERTATVDFIKVFAVTGFYEQYGSVASTWFEDVTNVANSFISFTHDDADFSFGAMEQDIMRETLKRSLQDELKKRVGDSKLQTNEDSPEYFFNDCNWFSETPCPNQFWIGDGGTDQSSRSSIQAYFSDSRAIGILRYFRSDLLQIEKALSPAYQSGPPATTATALASHPAPAASGPETSTWHASVAKDQEHALEIYQNNPDEFTHNEAGFYDAAGQNAMPSTRIDCANVQYPNRFNRVHFSEDCGMAFLAPKADLEAKRQDTRFLNGDDCPVLDSLVNRRVAIQRWNVEKIQQALSPTEISQADEHLAKAKAEYDDAMNLERSITGAVLVYDFNLYDDIDPYRQANPQFVWHHLPISNLDFSAPRAPDVKYKTLLSEDEASVTIDVGMETACDLRKVEPKVMQIAVLPALSAKYSLSSNVRITSKLNYKGILQSYFTTFDMDFFFISLRLNLLNTQNVEKDYFSLSIDSYGTDLSITERNRIYLEESYKLMKRLNDAYYDNFDKLFSEDGPQLTSRKPTVANKEQFQRIFTKADEACDENNLQNYSEGLMDSHCYPKHLVAAMTEILTNENLFRAISLYQDNAAQEVFNRSYFVQRNITMGVVQ